MRTISTLFQFVAKVVYRLDVIDYKPRDKDNRCNDDKPDNDPVNRTNCLSNCFEIVGVAHCKRY